MRRVCIEPDCGIITEQVRCHRHRRRELRPRQWARLARAQLAAEPNCRRCGLPACAADHIRPLALGGSPVDPRNLQSLCSDCHRLKTADDAIHGQETTWMQ